LLEPLDEAFPDKSVESVDAVVQVLMSKRRLLPEFLVSELGAGGE